MRDGFLLLTVLFSLALSTARGQSQPGPAYFLRHPVREPHLGAVSLPGGQRLPLLPPPAAPTVRAAAALAPQPTAIRQPAQASAAEGQAARYDLTGNRGFPSYDPYINLPETFRKNTLPPVWAEPLPLQLLRSALGK